MTDTIPTFDVETHMPEIEEEDPIAELKKTVTPRGVVKYIARTSVKFVVSGIVSSLVPEPENKIQRVKVAVGTYVIAGAVAKSTGSFVEEKFDSFLEDIRDIRAAVKKLESEPSDTSNDL